MSLLKKIKNFFSKNNEEPTPDQRKTVVGGFPTGKPIFLFVPLTNFYSEETKSSYVSGMKYTVREGNTDLATLAKKWRNQGKVVIL